MSEIYRVPPWIMLEYWELRHAPTDKPNTFTVVIFGQPEGASGAIPSYEGKGVSISHASKNAYRKRQKALLNDTKIPAKGSPPTPENTSEEDQPTETS